MGQLIGFLLFVVYAGGVYKFWKGFERTTYQRSLSKRLALSLSWPALLIVDKSYRRNFRKALKG